MKESWKIAVIGGCAGGAIALAVTFGIASLGVPPFAEAEGRGVHTYLITHPAVLVEMTNKLQAQQDADQDSTRQAAVNKLGLQAFFDPRVAFVTGPVNAKTSIVEFFDYNCPYCRASVPAIKKFYETHRQARFSFIEFPIKGPSSTVAARAAMAARQQPDKYVAFHFALMSESGIVDEDGVFAVARRTGLDVEKLRRDMASPAVDRALTQAHTLANSARIDGTPAFIIDGKIMEGAVDDETLAKLTKA